MVVHPLYGSSLDKLCISSLKVFIVCQFGAIFYNTCLDAWTFQITFQWDTDFHYWRIITWLGSFKWMKWFLRRCRRKRKRLGNHACWNSIPLQTTRRMNGFHLISGGFFTRCCAYAAQVRSTPGVDDIWGCQLRITSQTGGTNLSSFTSSCIQCVFKSLNIHKIVTVLHHPQHWKE